MFLFIYSVNEINKSFFVRKATSNYKCGNQSINKCQYNELAFLILSNKSIAIMSTWILSKLRGKLLFYRKPCLNLVIYVCNYFPILFPTELDHLGLNIFLIIEYIKRVLLVFLYKNIFLSNKLKKHGFQWGFEKIY